MARLQITLCIVGLFSLFSFVGLNAQPGDKPGSQLQNLETEYNEFLQNALKLQIRTDSLLRISNEKRDLMRSTGNVTEKSRLSMEIMALEQQAMDLQSETNKKYATARNLEMRLLAMRRSSQDPPPAAQPQGQIRPLDPKREDILLLTFFYGKPEMEPFVGLSALTKLRSVEKQAFQVNRMFNEVAEINQEVENIKVSINNDLRGRRKRNARKRVEELEKKSFEKNMEALTYAETVNSVKLEVLVNVVNAARINATVREQVQMASVHENAASENIREANESRRVAAEALSEKFVFDYLLRAYQKEAIAVEELLKAFDLLTGKTVLPPRIPEIVRSPERPAADPAVRKNPPGKETLPPSSIFPVAKPRYPDPSIPVNTALPVGQSYKIQIGIWQNDVAPPDFSGLPAMTAEVEEGSSSVRYYSGLYKRFAEAERALLDARRLGFRDAFIVAYLDSRRIPINRAVGMENQNVERVITPPAEIPAPAPLPVRTEQTAPEVVFKVQVGVFRDLVAPETRNRFMSIAGNQKVEFTRNDSGLYIYTIGNFTTFEEAVQAREQIVSAGIVDAFVVAFRGGEKIPLNQVVK